jgi:hypothetical protein
LLGKATGNFTCLKFVFFRKITFYNGRLFLEHSNYYIWALKVISCAMKLIKFPSSKIESETF